MNPAWLEQKLFRLYRLALREDPRALGMLFRYGVHCLETGQKMPRGVARLMAKDIRDPARYAARTTRTKRVYRGHPSIDDLRQSTLSDDLLAITGKWYFGRRPTEKYALMVQYLIWSGLTHNEIARQGRDSAVTVLAGLVNRSARQLQRDYKAHRLRMTGSPHELGLGKALYQGRLRIAELRKAGRQKNRPST